MLPPQSLPIDCIIILYHSKLNNLYSWYRATITSILTSAASYYINWNQQLQWERYFDEGCTPPVTCCLVQFPRYSSILYSCPAIKSWSWFSNKNAYLLNTLNITSTGHLSFCMTDTNCFVVISSFWNGADKRTVNSNLFTKLKRPLKSIWNCLPHLHVL